MGLFWVINDVDTRVAVWRITETEEELYKLSNNGIKVEYTSAKRRIEGLAVRLILQFLKIDEPIEYTSNGRPYLPSGQQNISISHSGPMVAVALNPKLHLGVDIEHIDRRYLTIASKYLTTEETNWIDLDNQKMMALAWCIKESAYKLPWDNEKIFTEDIQIPSFKISPDGGTVEVAIREGDHFLNLQPKYVFFDEYCLSWIVLKN